eukprot:Rhum_TRINITY_DN14618_c3_g1::Rhum_TRINITY_DN14618_c3_g1_i1::g.105921::m.105921
MPPDVEKAASPSHKACATPPPTSPASGRPDPPKALPAATGSEGGLSDLRPPSPSAVASACPSTGASPARSDATSDSTSSAASASTTTTSSSSSVPAPVAAAAAPAPAPAASPGGASEASDPSRRADEPFAAETFLMKLLQGSMGVGQSGWGSASPPRASPSAAAVGPPSAVERTAVLVGGCGGGDSVLYPIVVAVVYAQGASALAQTLGFGRGATVSGMVACGELLRRQEAALKAETDGDASHTLEGEAAQRWRDLSAATPPRGRLAVVTGAAPSPAPPPPPSFRGAAYAGVVPAGGAGQQRSPGGGGERVTLAELCRYYEARDGLVLARHVEVEMSRRAGGGGGGANAAAARQRRRPSSPFDTSRQRTYAEGGGGDDDAPVFAPPPPAHNCVIELLKKHSVVNTIFFRPPSPSYDERHKNVVLLKLRHTTPVPALWLPVARPAKALLIFAHSNACDIAQNPIVYTYRTAFHVPVLAPEWPGYGMACGKPSEQSLTETLLDTVLYANEVLNVPINRIVLYGRSLATGPCVEVAAALKRQGYDLGGVILKSAYLSWKKAIASAGADGSCLRRAATGVSHLVFDRCKSYERIKEVTCPLLFIHGKMDTVVQYRHSEQLHAAAGTAPADNILSLVEHGCHDYGIEQWEDCKAFFRNNVAGEPVPMVGTLPAACYSEVPAWCARARADRARWLRWRRVRWTATALVGVAAAAWGVVLATGALDRGRQACSTALHVWCVFHGATVVAGTGVYAAADWLQQDLLRARDPGVQAKCMVALVLAVLMFVADLPFAHVVLFYEDWDSDNCHRVDWWVCFGLLAATVYVYILQGVVTNK